MFRVTILFLLTVLFFHITYPEIHQLSAQSPTIRQQRYAAKHQNRLNKNLETNVKPRYSGKNKKNNLKTHALEKNNNSKFNVVESGIFSFIIPQNWQYIADKTQLPEKLDAICIGPGTVALTPTITISCEKTKSSKEEYIKEILEYHKREENTVKCSLFTTLESAVGPFNIIKVEKLTNFGEVALIQAILVKNRSVYIFTGTSLKESINELSTAFIQCVTSFKLNIQRIEDQSVDELILEAFEKLHFEEEME